MVAYNVPTANDVLVPETLLKKNKSCAKATEAAVAKKAELRKASILTFDFGYGKIRIARKCKENKNKYDDNRDTTLKD
ncbi:hypothetical protein MAM1_0187c07552 [Mucor ambiguus]|uniref:Uncharacterized protein n=1 Tax=Mucor ambiguus TaxID=91626 RepID=A0A0C9MBR3_9FUNG|nr:hypothetical protein MAM1_0187c07552 [Mucor ambiguus]